MTDREYAAMTPKEKIVHYLDVTVRDMLDGYDWLGTGSDMKWANQQQEEATNELDVILLVALDLPDITKEDLP